MPLEKPYLLWNWEEGRWYWVGMYVSLSLDACFDEPGETISIEEGYENQTIH